jgi:isopenicillin-N N-acyltransferase-like protein
MEAGTVAGRGYRRLPRLILTLITLAGAFGVLPGAATVDACTLWAAAGDRTVHGGSLIAKNRDWTPEADAIRWVDSKKGLRYLGLFPLRKSGSPGPVAGINEKGLAVVIASAGSLPLQERLAGGSGLMSKILPGYTAVAEVLAESGLFSQTHPAIYLLADRRRIAWIEVAPQGRFAIRGIENGVLSHTNHYLEETLTDANRKVGKSSRARISRIDALIAAHPAPLSLGQFITFSGDRSDGPDNSLWRTGGSPNGERTLASWIVSLPRDGFPELYIRLANPGEPEKTTQVVLDGPFWERRGRIL